MSDKSKQMMDRPTGTEQELIDWIEFVEAENARLKEWVNDLQSGMFINCVYCGHRYGPVDGVHLETMQDALRNHIEQCTEHPLSKAKDVIEAALRTLKNVCTWIESMTRSTRRT